MKRIARKILQHLPQRRRRMWKYVSPKRRRIGLFVLALLLTFLYAGWYFTNDAFIRQEAKKALENLTAGDVEIHNAQFSLFEGIKLEGVEVRLREDKSPQPFFYARKVVLKHNPLALFLRRRIEVTEIKCFKPEVNVEYDKHSGMSNAERLFRQAIKRKLSDSDDPLPLPSIYLVDGKLRHILKAALRNEIPEKDVDRWTWNCSLIPISASLCQVTLERRRGDSQSGNGVLKPAETLWAKFELDMKTGDIKTLKGSGTDQLFNLLPPKYQEWINRYQPKGEFKIVEGINTKPDEGLYEIQLEDFSLELPLAEGGLTLRNVKGRLFFTSDRVYMDNVTGKVIQAGQAAFTLNGIYKGYEKTSPFELNVKIENLRLPKKAEGTLEKTVSKIRKLFNPRGTADVSLKYQRDKTGKQTAEGVVTVNDISIQAKFFPLPLPKVSGNIYFTAEGIKSINLTAWRDNDGFKAGSTFNITGTFAMLDGYQTYNVTVVGTDVKLDSAFRDALKERHRKIWKMINPAGIINGRYQVIDPGRNEKNKYELDLDMLGNVSAKCKWFPYPLGNISGEVKLRNNTITLAKVESLSGEAVCEIEGRVEKVNKPKPNFNIEIIANNVPIDNTLRESFKGKAREFIGSLAARGLISRAEALIRRADEDEKIHYEISADVEDVSYKYEKFPYAISQAAGSLKITPEKIIIKKLKGKHVDTDLTDKQADTFITVNGEVILTKKSPRLGLTLTGKDVRLNDEFAQALPVDTRKVWESLNPSGLADMSIDLKTVGKGPESKLAYHFTLDAKGMDIRYREFPYTFRSVTGRAEVWPGRVVLKEMKASHGEMKATISGEILSGEKGDDVTMKISAKNIPFDREFLAAFPSEILPLSNRFTPGGKCNAEISKLTFHRDALPTINPNTKESEKTPPRRVTWSIEGGLGFRDVSLDIGFGPRKLTGIVEGKAAQDGQGLYILVDCELKRFELHRHVITNIHGKLKKNAKSNTLRLDDIRGNAYGGRLAGDATITLAEPLSYEMDVSVENINLSDFFNAGLPIKQRQSQVNGRLTGQLHLEATAGKKPTRQAVGELEISRGNMYKMPVILGLLNVIYLSLPGESAFNRGFIRYHLKNDKLIFQEIYLTGEPEHGVSKGISILGSGTLNMKTDALNLSFLTGPPGKLPRLDNVVEELLQVLSKELVEIRVTGTLKKPKMTTHHLGSLETIIKRIIEPSMKTE